ncbi:Phage protein [Pseudomonas mediterranea]
MGCRKVSPLEKLISWHENWALRNQVVKCKGCGAEQSESDRELAFIHEPSCLNARFATQPWQALDEVREAYWGSPETSSVD